MKNSLSKLVFSLVWTALLFSCAGNGSSENNNSEGYSQIGLAGDTTNAGISTSDTTNFRDGVPINEGFAGDTLQLPKPVLEAIEKDRTLKNAKIGQKLKKEENGLIFYEIVFYKENGDEQKVTFDSDGKRQSSH